MRVEEITYEADGIAMIGQLAFDDYVEGSRPAVLVAHEGPGIDAHVKGRALRLAALGYCTFALDYFGGGTAVYDREPMMARLAPLMADPAATRRRGLAGLEVLLDRPEADPAKVAVIGYCFGGTMALELARAGADIKAAVGFHPGLTRSNDSATSAVASSCASAAPIPSRRSKRASRSRTRCAALASQTGRSRCTAAAGTASPTSTRHRLVPRDWATTRPPIAVRRSMLHLFDDTIGIPSR